MVSAVRAKRSTRKSTRPGARPAGASDASKRVVFHSFFCTRKSRPGSSRVDMVGGSSCARARGGRGSERRALCRTAMRLRRATLSDAELLRHWDEQPHVLASDPNDEWGWAVELSREPDWREQLLAEEGG